MRVPHIVIGMVLMMAGGALLGWATVVAIVGIGAQLKPLESAIYITNGLLLVIGGGLLIVQE
jgi:hypothetical protein